MAFVRVDSFDGTHGYVESVSPDPMRAVRMGGATYLATEEIEQLNLDLQAAMAQGLPDGVDDALRTGAYKAFRLVSVHPDQNGGVATEVRDPDVLKRLVQKYRA